MSIAVATSNILKKATSLLVGDFKRVRSIRPNTVILLLVFFLCLIKGEEAGARPPVWTAEEGRLQQDNSSFFPIGMYYVAHYPDERSRRLQDLPLIAQAGFNTIHTPITGADEPFLDICKESGLTVIAEFNEDFEGLVERFKTHPALMAWSAYDDVDARTKLGLPRQAPSIVRTRTSLLHSLSPRLLTYVSGGFPDRIPAYEGTADAIGVQTYPIPKEPLKAVGDAYLGPLKELVEKQLVLANVQLFAWPSGRLPTPVEVRNMTYQSLVGGAKGLLYYTFYDKITDLREHPELVKKTGRLGGEIKSLRNFFQTGERCVPSSSDPETVAAGWNLSNRSLLVAVNTGTRQLSANLSGCPMPQSMVSLSDSAPLTPEQGGVTVQLKPLESAVYVSGPP